MAGKTQQHRNSDNEAESHKYDVEKKRMDYEGGNQGKKASDAGKENRSTRKGKRRPKPNDLPPEKSL